MSTLGIVLLVHTSFGRAEQVARHWASAGCPVVIHVDKAVSHKVYARFAKKLSNVENVAFSKRFRCEWGTWGIVAASQAASELLLSKFEDVRHVYLTSGSCLPLRPVQELKDYLKDRPRTDFIESAATAEVPWTVGGLDAERFTLLFPFSWRKHRGLFDGFVSLQRKLGFRRQIPDGLVPHMGSQWWCLTRQTLTAILQDPERQTYDKFFQRVWIPDESYFQTLARQYSTSIESRSLTLSKFDFQGKPHVFYDDHLQLLRRSDCFVARKIWPNAEGLYDAFLGDPTRGMKQAEPSPSKIDRVFSRAVERRTRGRAGLVMQSRFPRRGFENGMTAAPYSVFQGFSDLFEDFHPWLKQATGSCVHGHLFDPKKVEFTEGETEFSGALSSNAKLRDLNPQAFLTNLIWNTRGERQCFQYGPADTQSVLPFIAQDPNAQVSVITGAWAIPLFHSNRDFADIRAEAARLQKIENEALAVLRAPHVQARVRIWTMADCVEAPMEPLQTVIEEIRHIPGHRLTAAPRMVDLAGFGQFLQNLKNQGMHPYLTGDFPVGTVFPTTSDAPRKPYLVKN